MWAAWASPATTTRARRTPCGTPRREPWRSGASPTTWTRRARRSSPLGCPGFSPIAWPRAAEGRALRDALAAAVGVAVLAVAAGAALALAYPRVDWAGAAWIALSPVLVLALTRPPRPALGWGWLAGFVFFLLLLRWLNFTFRVYSEIPWPLTWLPTALLAGDCGPYSGLLAGPGSLVATRRGGPRRLAAGAVLSRGGGGGGGP